MRFAPYASASVALAASVVLKAIHTRPNFYSAFVYLGQSSACIMILTNLSLLVLGCVLLGLQKLLYGPLRPIELEQLYEKAWFAITETCLAMTIFREEVGAWFIIMFVSLLIGRVWSWIGEGRVEILEQQPPADPRLFHARLSFSLALSFVFTAYMLKYCINTVSQQARPTMMVMFAFEFAVLTVTSLSICARYGLSLREAAVIRQQTNKRLQERRVQLLQERQEATKRAEENGEPVPTFPPVEEEIDELDIDVPGWEEKGRWTFYLDLATDFLKLVLYLTFFCVLCFFYGMPIHIIRDVFLTIRSFYNRVSDFIKYRQATRDMNERYPDPTAEEISREDTCIICREPMRAWQAPGAVQGDVQGEGPAPMEERLRPKKLPCGHILHFACLRSWLERQQKCPTCRQDVVASTETTEHNQPNGNAIPPAANQRNLGNQQPPRNERPNDRGQRRNRVRFFNLGPLRLGFGAGNDPQVLQEQMVHERNRQDGQPGANRATSVARQLGLDLGRDQLSPTALRATELLRMERQLRQEINLLNLQEQELRVVRGLQAEFFRLRARRAAVERDGPDLGSASSEDVSSGQAYSLPPRSTPLNSGHPDLPQGVTIPEGWQLAPLTPYQPQFVPNGAFASLPPNVGIHNRPMSSLNPNAPAHTEQTEQTGSNPILSQTQNPSQNPAQNPTPIPTPSPTQSRFQTSSPHGAPNLVTEASNGATGPSAISAPDAGTAPQQMTSATERNGTSLDLPPGGRSEAPRPTPTIPNWGSANSSKAVHSGGAPSSLNQHEHVESQAGGNTIAEGSNPKPATVEDASEEHS